MQTMNESWSPGPWRLVHLDSGLVDANGADVIWGADDDIVGPVANKRLIEAGPEMAETLAVLADQLHWADGELGQGTSCGALADEADALLARIRGA